MYHKIMFCSHVRSGTIFCSVDLMRRKRILRKQSVYPILKKILKCYRMDLDTLVGEKGVALSGGQKQRISIARALVKNPEILILDDSLSAVDAKTEAKIIENIQAERSGKTTIITTHRLSAIQHADWIIVLG